MTTVEEETIQETAAVADEEGRDGREAGPEEVGEEEEVEEVDRTLMDWICEQHPNLVWPHDDCAGPGMPASNAEPEAHLAKSRPFATKVKDLETHVEELTNTVIILMDQVEQVTERLNKHVTELAEMRKTVANSDAVQLRGRIKKVEDTHRLHLQELH